MFEWISDAIDWISDGISSLWDNTVGAAADAISDAIWDIMFEWIFNKVYGLIAELFTFINETATDIFALSWVQVFVGLFGSFAWMLFVLFALASDISLFSLFFMILFGYCTVKVVFANIKRGGIMLCQIAVGSLYMFGVPRGYTDGFYSWCKQVIATCLTAFLQTTILYIGLLTYTQHPLLAVGICLSANEVPRIAQMYGLDTSVRVNMMSVSHTVSMGAKAVNMIKGKA